MPRHTPIYDLADRHVQSVADLDPLTATSLGVPGHDHELTDFSPNGVDARAARDRAAQRDLAPLDPQDDRDRIAQDVLAERLALGAELYDAGEPWRDLNILGSPTQRLRSVFDLMPRDTAEHWRNIAARLHAIPQALAGVRASLDLGRDRGLLAARRQALEVAAQCRVWGGAPADGGAAQPGFFRPLVDGAAQAGIDEAALLADLAAAADTAAQAYLDHARWLADDYAPSATPADPVGRDRYQLRARAFNGCPVDLDDTYAWGWDELRRIRRDMAATAERLRPGATVDEAADLLEHDPERTIDGVEPFRQWMQDLQDRTIASFDGVHFDIPAPVRRIEAMIAPPGGALAMYYTGPSEDFSRPGRTWYPTGGHTSFPLWREVTVAYHEGVPGHHLQIAQTRYLGDELSRYQRLLAGSSGYVEGWALYAERLMDDLGYLDDPGYHLGYLSSQAFRAARVVLDIGLHLELPIPPDEDYHPGQTWTPELAHPFLFAQSYFPADMLASEIDRYLGLPGQAISYKVGERAWLEARDAARTRAGDAFDLKAWHTQALNLGPMGLAQMQRELTPA